MPFQSQAYRFDNATLNTVNELAGVYGLLQQTAYGHRVLYVGLTDNFRRRLREHFNNPPITGATHFAAEILPYAFQRTVREQELIREFNPPGNVHHTR
jgi:excinuclease UvrABC nuclease subunit